MSDPLSDFLRAAARRPFSFQDGWDCGRFTAAWVERCCGFDPGVEWWGRYSTALGLGRLLKRRGGMVAHFDACLVPRGIERTAEPKRGDVAIVHTPDGEEAAIVLGKTVAMIRRLGPGLIIRPRSQAPIIAAWSITDAVAR